MHISFPPPRALRFAGLLQLVRVILGASFALTLLLLPSCGGGSVGTGTGENLTTIEGRILSSEGTPIEGATVDVGDAAPPGTSSRSNTDTRGHFVIALPSTNLPSTIQLEVSAPSQQAATVPVDATPVDPAAIVVQVVVDQAAPPVAIQSTDLSVQIVGACATAFTNNRDIIQTQPIEPGTICTASISAKEDGLPRSAAKFRLEVRACDEFAPWTEIGSGVTVSDGQTATGLVDFPFIEDVDHCVYRIVAPVDEPTAEQTAFVISTLLKQNGGASPAPSPADTPGSEPTPEPTATPALDPLAEPTPQPTQEPPPEPVARQSSTEDGSI
ncbi:MAG: carboxypeptidase-like regulatory domain-containing protein [Bdellovibrionota bacterium]